MEIEVTLCGHTASWHFAGSNKFKNWASQIPWQNDGGLCIIRTGAQVYSSEIQLSLERTIYGLNGQDRTLYIQKVICTQGSTPFESFLRSLELDSRLGEIEARDRIRTRLLDKPTVFLFVEETPLPPHHWETLIQVVEHYRKTSVPLCAIVIDNRGVVHAEPICDFTVGRCTHQVFRPAIGLDAATVWRAYLHHRISWECAGDLSLAFCLAETAAKIGIEDDESLELLFQQNAISLSSHASFDLLRKVICSADSRQSYKSSDIHELVESRLMWFPPSIPTPRVVPWAARVLLHEKILTGREISNLRHGLICSPLAAEIMAICLQVEQHVRSRLHNRGDVNKLATTNASENQENFTSGLDPATHYPNAHPAPPTSENDIWVFASLGEVLYCCPKPAVSDLDRNMLALRNGVAHGHYIGWQQVKMALKQLNNGVVIY